MQSWAAPLCDTIQQAHRGRFDADALRDVYAADAVFESESRRRRRQCILHRSSVRKGFVSP